VWLKPLKISEIVGKIKLEKNSDKIATERL
jgi:hypothetical protein